MKQLELAEKTAESTKKASQQDSGNWKESAASLDTIRTRLKEIESEEQKVVRTIDRYEEELKKAVKTGRNNSADEMSMAKALPHWTVEEFLKQLQNFLNVTEVFNDIDGTVDIVSSAYTEGVVNISDVTQNEYEVEVINDEDVESNLYNSNVKYKEGESEYHDIDLVEREVIDSFNEIACSAEESQSQWNMMSDEDKKQTVWSTPEGQFCAKINTSEDGKTETLERIRFNHFGSIVRNSVNVFRATQTTINNEEKLFINS